MADAMDHEVGRLVAHLKETGQYENTVFVFLSDNGPEGSDYRDAQLWLRTQYTQDIDRLGGRGAYAIPGPGWASATASPLAGFKFIGGEGATRVPMIMAGVRGGAAGTVHDGLVHVTDIAPTLLELAGIAPALQDWKGRNVEPITGRSLVPVLQDPYRRVRGPDDVLGYEMSGEEALFRGDLKLVRGLPPLGDGRWRLFDLRADPGETTDLSAQHPDAVQAMRAAYEAWARDHHVLPMPEGYSPARQVLVNTLLDYWLPTYVAPSLGVLALAALAFAWLRRGRRIARPSR
jgi:arylsulfatase/uncharacterized sulfatase